MLDKVPVERISDYLVERRDTFAPEAVRRDAVRVHLCLRGRRQEPNGDEKGCPDPLHDLSTNETRERVRPAYLHILYA